MMDAVFEPEFVTMATLDPGTIATVNHLEDKLNVLFHSPVSAVAPGQSAVFYEGEDLVGGGIIERQKPILI